MLLFNEDYYCLSLNFTDDLIPFFFIAEDMVGYDRRLKTFALVVRAFEGVLSPPLTALL